MKIEKKQLQSLLNETRPGTRAKSLVRRARRAIWVLMAPILQHLFNQYSNSLRSLTGLMHSVRDGAALRAGESERRIDRLENEVDRLATLYKSLLGEFPKYVQPMIEFRTEAAALVNRGSVMERDLALLSGRIERVGELEQDLVRLSGQIEKVVESQILAVAIAESSRSNAAAEIMDARQALEYGLSATRNLVEDLRKDGGEPFERLRSDVLTHHETMKALETRVSAMVEGQVETALAAYAAAEAVEVRLASMDTMESRLTSMEGAMADLGGRNDAAYDALAALEESSADLRASDEEMRRLLEGLEAAGAGVIARSEAVEAALATLAALPERNEEVVALGERLGLAETTLAGIEAEVRGHLAASNLPAEALEAAITEIGVLKSRMALIVGGEIDRKLDLVQERGDRRIAAVETELRVDLARVADKATSAINLGDQTATTLAGVVRDLASTASHADLDRISRDLGQLRRDLDDQIQDSQAFVTDATPKLTALEKAVAMGAARAETDIQRLDAGLREIRVDLDRINVDLDELPRRLDDGVKGLQAMVLEGEPRLAALKEKVEAGAVRIETEFQRLYDGLVEARTGLDRAAGDMVDIQARLGEAETSAQEARNFVGHLDRTVSWLSARTDDAWRRSRLFLSMNRESLTLLRADDLISETVAVEGEWDAHVVELMDKVRRIRNGTAVDIGAQFGLISVAMGQRFDRVVSFEPNDFNYRMLLANVVLNGLSNVECRNHPLFSSSVLLSLGTPEQQESPLPLTGDGRFDPMAAANSASYAFTQNGLADYAHEALTLDSLELEDVAFIKIDVQGADGEIIMGARDTLKRCRPVMVFEWEQHLSENFSVSLEKIESELKKLGYSISVLKQHNPKQIDYVAYPKEFKI